MSAWQSCHASRCSEFDSCFRTPEVGVDLLGDLIGYPIQRPRHQMSYEFILPFDVRQFTTPCGFGKVENRVSAVDQEKGWRFKGIWGAGARQQRREGPDGFSEIIDSSESVDIIDIIR